MQARALIADGDAADSSLIQEVMREGQMPAVVVHDGKDAAPLLKAEKFSLLIVDFLGPTVNGVELTKAARFAGPNQMTPIVVLSNHQDPSAVSKAFNAGANFFLYKPIDRGRLLGLLRAAHASIEHERRRFRRVPLQLRMKLLFEDHEYEGETINVSLNGVLVRMDAEIPTGSRVRASLWLTGDAKPIDCGGTIMRALGANRVGILLDHVTVADNVRLQAVLLPTIRQGAAEQVWKV
jgi:DNA-binding response OmpR family regulator